MKKTQTTLLAATILISLFSVTLIKSITLNPIRWFKGNKSEQCLKKLIATLDDAETRYNNLFEELEPYFSKMNENTTQEQSEEIAAEISDVLINKLTKDTLNPYPCIAYSQELVADIETLALYIEEYAQVTSEDNIDEEVAGRSFLLCNLLNFLYAALANSETFATEVAKYTEENGKKNQAINVAELLANQQGSTTTTTVEIE